MDGSTSTGGSVSGGVSSSGVGGISGLVVSGAGAPNGSGVGAVSSGAGSVACGPVGAVSGAGIVPPAVPSTVRARAGIARRVADRYLLFSRRSAIRNYHYSDEVAYAIRGDSRWLGPRFSSVNRDIYLLRSFESCPLDRYKASSCSS